MKNSFELLWNVIYAVIIAALLVYFFRKKPKLTVKQMIFTALFIVIPAVVNMALTFSFYLGGVVVMKIGIHQHLMAIGGMMISMPFAIIAGIIFDIIGLIFTPTPHPYVGFTFNYVLCYGVGSLIFHSKKQFSKKTIYALLITAALFTTVLLFQVKQVKLESLVIKMEEVNFLIQNRYLLLSIVYLFTTFLIGIVHFSNKLLKKQSEHQVNQWIFIVLFIELVVNVLFTSFHLHIMYQIPLSSLMLARLIKACVLSPVYIFIGYFIMQFMKKIGNNHDV